MLVGKTYSTLCLFLSFGFCIIALTTGCSIPREASPTAPTPTADGQRTTPAESAETTVHTGTAAPTALASASATTSEPTPTTAVTEAPPSPTPLPCPDNLPQSMDAPPAEPLRLFFIEEGNIRLWQEATGKTSTLVGSGDVHSLHPAPDGQVIAFLRRTEAGRGSAEQTQMALWAIDSAGDNERRLISADRLRRLGGQRLGDLEIVATNPTALQWILGTHRLAFRLHPIVSSLGTAAEPEIRLVNADTGELSFLLSSNAAGNFTFSPDGRRMTLADETGIDVLDVDGQQRRNDVVTYPQIGLGHVSFQAHPVWAPDSSFFLVALPADENPSASDAANAIWWVAADGANSEQIAAFTGFPLRTFGRFGSAIFSPNLSQIAFYQSGAGNAGDLFIADVTGAWQILYDSGELIRFLGWAPDGRHFAYAAGASSDRGERPLRLGRLCRLPAQFDGPPVAADTPVTWVDAERFLYLSAPRPDGSDTRLRLLLA